MTGHWMRRGDLWFAAAMAARYLLPLAVFGGVAATVHDNLDSDVVYSIVIGRWLAGDAAAFDVFLGGVLDWRWFARSTQPISLIYAALPPVWAYAVTEILVAVLAYAGMRTLLRTALGPDAPLLPAVVYGLGLSFSSFGLGLAAAPWFAWLLVRERPLRPVHWALAFALGWNTALALHALFLPVALPAVVWALGRRVPWGRWAATQAVALAGAAVGAAGLIWLSLAGVESHRADWPAPAVEGLWAAFLGDLASDLAMLGSHYHAVVTPALYAAPILLAGAVRGGAAARAAAAAAGLIALSAALSGFAPLYRSLLPGVLASLQWDRVGLFAPLAVLAAGAVLLSRTPRAPWVRGVLVLSAALAWLAHVGVSPAAVKPLLPPGARDVLDEVRAGAPWSNLWSERALGGVPRDRANLRRAMTVGGHFRADAYACIADAVGTARVISVGVDPMIAPANGIAAVDGYHNLYPLAYKAAFRPVIAAKLAASPPLRRYYDDWGSRVGTFARRAPEVPPELGAARALGARYVVAARALPDPPGAEPVPLACLERADVTLWRLPDPDGR
ncbi:hypothetical protein DXV76_11095 [Rhodobacteraceae bacterium CCMM004]|nr:hypothetical protein DXV76_11095 [Rhodobacteraceae bacterium CCMM004]